MADVIPEVPSGMTLIRAIGPRLLRDILGPPLAFYGGWKLTGHIVIGIAIGTFVALAVFAYERRHGRPGLIARVVLLFVLVQAVVGFLTGSATAYLIQPAALGVVNGLLWLGSVAIGRPLAGTFAQELFPVSDETRASEDYVAVFRRVSVMFGIFFVIAAAVQLVILLIVGVGAFLVTRVFDAVGILAMIVYCVHYIRGILGERLVLAELPVVPTS